MDTNTLKTRGMGWLRDLPDFRDYTPEHEKIKPLLKKINMTSSAAPASLPASVDLRAWCSPIEDQRDLGSCTAQAGVGLIEFYERRAFGTHIDASRLFLYKVTRNLLGWTGDTGAYLSTTMAAMTLFGAPPEKYWPYTTAKPGPVAPPTTDFDMEPPAFCYAFAQNYQSIDYYRLDPPGVRQLTCCSGSKPILLEICHQCSGLRFIAPINTLEPMVIFHSRVRVNRQSAGMQL